MKKIAFILLISLYTFFSVGLCLQLFYCGGKLKSVRVEVVHNEGKENCEKRDQAKNDCCTKGCCKTEHQFLKIDDTHIASAYVKAPATPVFDIDMMVPSYDVFVTSYQQNAIIHNTSPPHIEQGIPLYVSNCIYRI